MPLPQPREIESGGVEKKHVDSPYNYEAVSCNGAGGALPLPQPREIESGGVEKKHVDSPYNHEAVSCNGTGGALPLPYKIPVIATSGKALLAMTGELGGFGGRSMIASTLAKRHNFCRKMVDIRCEKVVISLHSQHKFSTLSTGFSTGKVRKNPVNPWIYREFSGMFPGCAQIAPQPGWFTEHRFQTAHGRKTPGRDLWIQPRPGGHLL